MRRTELSGKTFGMLRVIGYAHSTKKGEAKWRCMCECGNSIVTLAASLMTGKTISCGCYRKKVTAKLFLARGDSPAQPKISTYRVPKIVFGEKELTITEWSKMLGFKQGTIYHRLKNGWTVEKALTTPVTVHLPKPPPPPDDGKPKMKKSFIDMTGQRIGRLLITGHGDFKKYRSGDRILLFKWVCDCGATGQSPRNLLMNYKKSCGCLMRESQKRKVKGPVKNHNIRLGFGESAKRCVLLGYKQAAKKKGRTWNLPAEYFYRLIASNCHYCGSGASNRKETGKFSGFYEYNGIDRVDCSIGYEPGNVVACCRTCNRAKFQMSSDEFVDWALRVVNHTQPHILRVA